MDFQVIEPLRAMVIGSPLEDARHLAQRYSKMRQEAEIQVTVTIISIAKDFDDKHLFLLVLSYYFTVITSLVLNTK